MAIEDQAQTTILAIEVDTGNSAQEFQKVSAAADKMGGVISNAADVAAAALERQGQAQEQAAKQSKRSTDAAVRTLQTEIAAREAGGRATARYYELIYANSSKVDQQAIAPLIAKYKELEAQQVAAAAASKQRAEAEKKAAQDAAAAVQAQMEAQKAATAAAAARAKQPIGVFADSPATNLAPSIQQMEKLGMTAKATSAALRQVPAQFTDIVVSLQGGQAPLTVFLQQGGQLKDVFGGAGAAAQALGRYVVGLINPLTLAAAAVAAVAYGYNQGATEVQKFNAALITTNNAAGTTAGGLADLASQAAKAADVTKGAAAEVVTAFAKSGAFNTDQIERFSVVAIRAQREIGTSVADTITAFKNLGEKPLETLLKLNEGTNFLTRSVYEQVKALEEQGRVTEAAAVAQKAYADSSDGVTTKLGKNLGTIERGWRAIKDASKEALDTLLEVGRAPTPADKLSGLGSAIEGTRRRIEGGTGKNGLTFAPAVGDDRARLQERLAALEKQRRALLDQQAAVDGIAAAEAAGVKQLQAKIELDKIVGKSLDKRAAAEREILALRDKYGKQAANDATIAIKLEEAIAAVRAKAVDKVTKPTIKVDENLRELSQYTAALDKRIEKEQRLTEVQKAQAAIARAASNDANGQVQAYILDLAAQLDAEEATTAARKASEAALKSYNKELESSSDSVAKSLQKYQDENAALALSKASYISLEEAVNDLTIARLEEQLVKEKIANNPAGQALIEKEIRDRKELAKEIRSKDVREANDKAAKSAADSWKKAADQIGDSITDALFRGFESGKGFIDNLIATTENAFKTMVLRPVVQGTVSALTNAGASSLGLGAASSAAGGVAQLGGLAALGSTFGSSLAAGFSGTLTAGFTGLGATLSGGLSAIATGTASTMAAGLGQIVGALGPIGLGAAALYGLAGGFKGEYVSSTGDANVAFNALGQRTRTSTAAEIGAGRFDAKLTEGADKLVVGLNTAYLESIKKLGATAKFTDFFFGGNTSEGGKFTLGSGVGGVGSVFNSGEQKGGEDAVRLAASRAVFAALKASDLPQYLAKVFDGITASTATLEQIDAATNYAVSLKSIRDALTETRTPLQVLQANVDSAFTSLGTSAASFKTDFVAAIDAGISPERLVAFQELGANLDALGKTAGTTAEAARSLTEIATERANLQRELDNLTLSSTDLLAKQRDALDESNRSLFDQVQAANAAKEANDAAAEAARNVADERKGLQDQLDAATLTAVDLLAKQRNALDGSNMALFDQVQAANAAKAAVEAFNGSMSSLGDTRFDLENQILTLQGNTGEVATRNRTNDLAKLTTGITDEAQIKAVTEAYDYNESLKAQIKSFGDAKAAADAAAESQSRAADESANAAKAAEDAANSVRDAMKSIADSLTDAAAQIRGDIVKQGAGGFAAAQAQFTVTAAQAKAGDEAAAKSLPQLASALVQIAQTSATSEAQLRSVRASTAGTLDEVAALLAAKYGFQTTSTATVATSVPTAQQPTVPTQQTVVQPVFYNSITGQAAAPADSAATLAELAKITALLEALSAKTTVTAEDIATTRRVLQLVTRNGASMQVAAETPGLLTRTS